MNLQSMCQRQEERSLIPNFTSFENRKQLLGELQNIEKNMSFYTIEELEEKLKGITKVSRVFNLNFTKNWYIKDFFGEADIDGWLEAINLNEGRIYFKHEDRMEIKYLADTLLGKRFKHPRELLEFFKGFDIKFEKYHLYIKEYTNDLNEIYLSAVKSPKYTHLAKKIWKVL